MEKNKQTTRTSAIRGQIIVWSLTIAMAVTMAVGDVQQVEGDELFAAEVAAEVAPAPAEQETSEPAAPAETIQSLNFKKDMTIKEALRFLQAKYQKNIVPSPQVEGVLGFTTLYDVTFEQALDAILGERFAYEQKDNLIKVYTRDEYNSIKQDEGRMVERVFTLYYVNSAEMQKLVAPVLSTNARVAASTSAEQDTTAGQGGNSLAMHDALVVYDYPEYVEKAAKIVAEVDVKPPAILLDVTILEAQLKDLTEFGIDLSTVGCVAITCGATEGIATSGFASASGGTTSTSTSGLTAAFSIDDVTGFLRALESITDTTVLANPKILALNKQAGHILIGSRDGYLTITQISEGGTATQEVDFLETGTTLKFRPYVCKDGYIRMEINPKQSSGAVESVGGYVLPTEDTTEVATNIMVKDGKTIVIGGLFKDDISQAHSQVPLLGDLPVVGAAFQQVKDTVTRKELIILITPHIIDDPATLAKAQEVQDVKMITEGAHKSLNIMNRTRIFEDRLAIAEQYYKDGYYEAALAELESILEARPNFPRAERLRQKVLKDMIEVK